ncbi:MAG: radical SAM protein [Candidatus Aenigmatarchaeota archaeon]
MNTKLMKAQVHLTHFCNLKCIFCNVPANARGKRDLSEKKWLEINNDLCDLHPEIVTISGGGEPLLRKNLIRKMLKLFYFNEIKTELITNGTLVAGPLAKEIVEYVECLRVSIHSLSPILDRLLRGVYGSLNKSIKGIKEVAAWKEKLKRDKPTIDVVMVITTYNIMEIEKMIKKARKLGVNKISLRITHKYGEKYKPNSAQFKYLQKKMKYFENLAKKEKIILNQDFLPEIFGIEENNEKNVWHEKNFPLCSIPFREIVVFADGRVAPCCNFIDVPEAVLPVESVKNKKLKDIWFGRKFNELRESMLKRKEKIPKICRECSIDLKPIDKRYKEYYEDDNRKII